MRFIYRKTKQNKTKNKYLVSNLMQNHSLIFSVNSIHTLNPNTHKLNENPESEITTPYKLLTKTLPQFKTGPKYKLTFTLTKTLDVNTVTYWPSIEPSIKKQVHQVEDITLTCGRVEFGADATPIRSRWSSNNHITGCHRRFELVGVSWSSSCHSKQWEPARDRGLVAFSDPRLSSPAE